MKTMELLDAILDPELDRSTWQQWRGWVRELSDEEYRGLIEGLAAAGEKLAEPRIESNLERVLPVLVERQVAVAGPQSWIVSSIGTLYVHSRSETNLRNLWLGWLAQIGSDAALEAWLDLVREAPPKHRVGLVAAFGPLVNRFNLPRWFYTRLVDDAMRHSQTAAATLDLINFHVRRGVLEEHPAAAHAVRLTSLLEQVVQRLHEIEQGESPYAANPAHLQLVVSDSVALVVSLCDTLAMCHELASAEAIAQAMQLRHRRIQCEAAAALARLDVELGRQRLIELASEPVMRLQVLAYAEELEILHCVPEQQRSDLAIAESRLALWLADPQRVGLAPSRMELVEFRELNWPSFEHPVGVYLFRYYYGTGPDATSNIGIVGPMVHAFERDIGAMSLEDVLAAFAGWQAVHDDIYEVSLAEFRAQYPQLITQRERLLAGCEFEDVQWLFAGSMMGEWILVGAACLAGERGFIMLDEYRVTWFAADADPEMTGQWAYMVYRGRRMLQAFNDDFESPD